MAIQFIGLGVRAVASAIPLPGAGPAKPRGFSISVDTDIRAAQRMLKRVGERNIPMALAQSLTATAKHLSAIHKRSMGKYIDRPTPFTRKGIGYQYAKWKDYKRGAMYASVFVKPTQSEYLKYQVFGGRRTSSRTSSNIVVPGLSTKLNKYGNLTRTYLRTQSARSDTHVAKINGVNGLWKTMKSGRIKLLVMFTDDAQYKSNRWPFFKISKRVVDRELPRQLNKAVKRALNKGR
tara:strand:+ start:3852 stop:4556 length:705 start_codon:yes stop_codon:yes gene_type:complete